MQEDEAVADGCPIGVGTRYLSGATPNQLAKVDTQQNFEAK